MTLLSPNFFINSIKIGTVEGASCVNFGNNSPSGFNSFKKHNQGFGSVSGDGNKIDGIRSLLNDGSLLDLLTIKDQESIPEWVEELIQLKVEEEKRKR